MTEMIGEALEHSKSWEEVKKKFSQNFDPMAYRAGNYYDKQFFVSLLNYLF